MSTPYAHELLAPNREGMVSVGDGRTLGYAVFGRGERAVIWLHGTPGGRRQIPPAARAYAVAHDVRVIGIERPGIGDSTPHLYGQLHEFAHDVERVLDALQVERAAVVGLSGGGPYALACAHSIGRIEAAGVLGGVAPSCGPEAIAGGVTTLAGFARVVEPIHAPLGAVLSAAVRRAHPLASQGFDLFMKLSGPGDRAVFQAPGMKAMFLDDMLRASKTGLHTLIYDYLLFSREWGFSLADVAVPVQFWHGDADPFVPLAHGRHLADRVPNATLTIQPGQSHLGGLASADEVLGWLLG